MRQSCQGCHPKEKKRSHSLASLGMKFGLVDCLFGIWVFFFLIVFCFCFLFQIVFHYVDLAGLELPT